MEVSRINNNVNNSMSFKAFNASRAKAHLMKSLFKKDIMFYPMDQACLGGIEAYKSNTVSPCLGEFISNIQLESLKLSPNYKKMQITDAEATKLKLSHPRAVYDKLLEMLENPQSIKISDLFKYSKQLKAAKHSSSQNYKKVVGEITEKLDTKLDETDYFMINATKKWPNCIPRRFYPN